MTPRHRVGRVARMLGLGAVMLGPLSGCGGASGPPGIDRASAAELRQAVQTIRAAVARHDAAGARAAVANLRHDVARLEAKGDLDPTDGRVLGIEARQVLAEIAVRFRPTASTAGPTSTTTTPTTAAPGPGPGPPPGKGKGKNKDKGKGGDGGD